MKTLNISLNLGSVSGIFKKHISILLWLFLVVVILLEATIVKGALDMILRVRNTPPNVQTSTVRVNIPQYDAIEKLLEQNVSYEPSVTTNSSPFGQTPRGDN